MFDGDGGPAWDEHGAKPTTRPLVLTADEVAARWRDHPRTNYLFIFSVIKGVAVANAAFALTRPELMHPQRLPFWLVSFLGLILSYYAASVGTVILPLELGLLDTVLPFFVAVAEFLMFSAVAAGTDQHVPRIWFASFGVWAGLTSCVIWSVRRLCNEENVEPTMQDLMKNYRTGLVDDGAASGLCAAVSAGVWIVYPRWFRHSDWWELPLVAAAGIFVIFMGILGQQRYRTMITKFLEKQARVELQD